MKKNILKNFVGAIVLIVIGYSNLAFISYDYSDQEIFFDVYCYYDGSGELAFHYCLAGGSYFCNCADQQLPQE